MICAFTIKRLQQTESRLLMMIFLFPLIWKSYKKEGYLNSFTSTTSNIINKVMTYIYEILMKTN
jgi:hypothetical protein